MSVGVVSVETSWNLLSHYRYSTFTWPLLPKGKGSFWPTPTSGVREPRLVVIKGRTMATGLCCFQGGGTCSQKTQATVLAATIGTQCAFKFITSSVGVQATGKIGVPKVGCTRSGTSFKRLHSSRNVTSKTSQAPKEQRGTCTCSSRAVANGHKGALSEGDFHSCQSCQQRSPRKTTSTVLDRAGGHKKSKMCSVCKETFRDKYDLQAHWKIHTGHRPFVCHSCQKRFLRKSHLAEHEKIHSDERPYPCTICQKSFFTKADLNKHERVHTGERPYACGVCGETFTQKSTLLRHGRLHSGERPYACSVCEKRFAQETALLKHLRLHVKEMYAGNLCQK